MTSWQATRRGVRTLWRFNPFAADDIFISYHRGSAAAYARGLYRDLAAKGFLPFDDSVGTEAGDGKLPSSVVAGLTKCKLLVVLGTRGAARSRYVDQEVSAFAAKRGTRDIFLVVFSDNTARSDVNLRSAIDAARWARWVTGKTWVVDTLEALESGNPSPRVVKAIEKAFGYTKSKERIAAYVRRALATMTVLCLGIAGASYIAYVQSTKAVDATQKALTEAERAEKARMDADEATKRADLLKDNATALELAASSIGLRATDPTRALRLAQKAFDISPEEPAVLRALYGAYYGQAHCKSTGVGDAVLSMVTSPAGDTVAVATPKGGVTLLKPTGKPIQVGAVEGPARATAFSPDGALIAFGTDTAIAVYTVDRKLRARATLHSVGVTDVAFGRDSSSVFVATRYRGIYRFDLATQTPAIFTGASGDGLLDGTLSVAVSPDGPHVAASFADGQIRVWNLDGQPVGAWKSDRGAASHVVFVREGQRLLAGHVGGRVCLWSLDGKLHDCVEAARSIDAFAVSPDGKSFVTADDDFTAKYWTLPETDRFDSSARVELRGHTNRVRGIAFDTKGRVLTGSYDGTLRRWQFAQPRTIAAGNSLRRFAVFSPVDANRLLTNGGYNTVLVDLDGRIVKEFPNPPAEYQVAVTAAAYAPAGDFVLTGSYGGSLALWRIDGALIWRRHVGGEISAVLFDPESKTAYAALKASSRDWHVLRFDWERFTKPNVVLVTHRRINGVAVASSGDIIVTAEGGNNGTDGQILIHRRGQTLKSIIVDRDQPRAVVFSPDRHLLLLGADLQTPAERGTTAGFVRHSASVLDESFNEVMVLGGHLRMVTSAAFSSDGKYVLTGSGESNLPDAEMRLWTAGGVLLFAAAADKDVAAVAFSPAGSHIAAAAGPDLKLWLMARALRRHLDTLDIDIE